MKYMRYIFGSVVVALLCGQGVVAGVTAEEAAKLKTELTPLGAERAGNNDGSIPAWTGGFKGAIPGWKPGQRRIDPFKDEKPLYSITAKNVEQYSAILSDGQKAMFKRDPNTYRIDVYKTHRTAVAPQWVYDNTAKNAVNGRLDNGVPVSVKGGIPFPIPKTGVEVMFNHLLRWRGQALQEKFNGVQVTADGKLVLTVTAEAKYNFPYYIDGDDKGEYYTLRIVNSGPPIRAGEQIVDRQKMDGEKSQAWVYLTGQRRVRKLPNLCCDTPAPPTAGLMSTDEIGMFLGRVDRFDWKIIGKKEILVPYNSNRTLVPQKYADIIGPKHVNPDHVRWELHRVWIVESTLKEGQRHQVSKSRYYFDEDTWMALLSDRWDGKGQLWKTLWTMPFVAPDAPGNVMGMYGYYDFLNAAYYVNEITNEFDDGFQFVRPFRDTTFTPDAMAAEAVR